MANADLRPETRIHVPENFSTLSITPVTHTLVDHPLLTLSVLRELAQRRPPHRVRWHRADIPVDAHFGNAAREHANGNTLLETLDTIENARSWVYLMRIEEDPLYAPLMQELFRSVAAKVEAVDPGAHDVFGWCFISSPGAVTPYHMDHETNFLLQIHGSKTIHVWEPTNRAVVSEEELEAFHSEWSLEKVKWRPEFDAHAHRVEAKPGNGVFMPFTAPHAVKNHDAVSITLSMTFISKRNEMEQKAFAANRRLRALGLKPTPVGKSPRRDRMVGKALDLYMKGHGYLRQLRGGQTKADSRY
jgi:hypothetical protein